MHFQRYPFRLTVPEASRLQDTKMVLMDLGERQLSDLLDMDHSNSQTDVEDIDKLLAEMHTVRRCMETVVSIERALNDQ